MNIDKQIPQGNMLLRTWAMPADTNYDGDISGGWVMSQMDIAGVTLANEISDGPTVTIAADSMNFISPIKIGDVVCCYGSIQKIGRTSITIDLEVWIRPILRQKLQQCPMIKVTEASYTYVAIDDNGKKRLIKP